MLILVRGSISYCKRSMIAKMLHQIIPNSKHIIYNQYFQKEDKFEYNPLWKGDARDWAYKMADKYLSDDMNVIVEDNFLTKESYHSFIHTAINREKEIRIVELTEDINVNSKHETIPQEVCKSVTTYGDYIVSVIDPIKYAKHEKEII